MSSNYIAMLHDYWVVHIFLLKSEVKRMKLVAFALVALISFLCLAAHQRALVGSRRDDVMMKTNQVDRNIDNHHNIPRQYYNQWGSGGDNNGDNNANEGGWTISIHYFPNMPSCFFSFAVSSIFSSYDNKSGVWLLFHKRRMLIDPLDVSDETVNSGNDLTSLLMIQTEQKDQLPLILRKILL